MAWWLRAGPFLVVKLGARHVGAKFVSKNHNCAHFGYTFAMGLDGIEIFSKTMNECVMDPGLRTVVG